ncbi:MAG: ferrous iron transport protein A [Provencibacterium sp.]|nr:ferrous iron transport protein A [Provencibacterium sp.]
MKNAIPLNHLVLNQCARVQGLNFAGNERRRLLDLGFREGSIVRPVLASPSGNPMAYQVCGAIVALRACDSRRIAVMPVERDGGAC